MSTRTALRRLRHNRVGTAWGTRYTLTVRVPRDAFPDSYPMPSPELTAHLAGYGPTGDFGIGKQNGDGTGVRLELHDELDNDCRVARTYATALVGDVVQYESDWWGVTNSVEKHEDDAGWEWLREYADNVVAQGRWVERNLRGTPWPAAAMNDAWSLAQSGKDACWHDRETVNGVDTWRLTFAVKVYNRLSVDCMAKGVARFVQLARRAGIAARYF